MPEKTVSISVRLSADDSAFLAGYNPPGATTLSEKVRSVIAEARKRSAGSDNYSDSLNYTESLVSPAMHRLRELEATHRMHSELMLALTHWLPDATATLMADIPSPKSADSAAKLAELESKMADRIFALIEQVLRMGVTRESPCYDPSLIAKRIATIVKLSEIIKDTHN